MYTMEYYSAIKKNEIMSFAATWMDLEIVTLSEVREREISYDIPYMWNLKRNYTNSYLQNKNRLIEQSYNCQGKGLGGEIVREFGIDMYTVLYLNWIAIKGLLYSTENSAQCYVAAQVGEEFGGE